MELTAQLGATLRKANPSVKTLNSSSSQIHDREAESSDRLPAVALTAYITPEDRNRALAAGFAIHLGKPVEGNELVDAIAKIARK